MREERKHEIDDSARDQPSTGKLAHWRDRAIEALKKQLSQGSSPRKIALTVAFGVTLGLFPIFGSTTLLCLLAGIVLRLNQPALQFVNYLMSPVQLASIYGFVRLGEWVSGANPIELSSRLLQKAQQMPLQFLEEFGRAGLLGILGWLVVAPGLVCISYLLVLLVIRFYLNIRQSMDQGPS